MRITVDSELIRHIGTELITGVGDYAAIAKFEEGGICWRRRGATMDTSLEAQWLVERLT